MSAEDGPARARWERLAPWLPVSVIGVVLILDRFAPRSPSDVTLTEEIIITLGFLAFAVAGALVLRHRPRHTVGWILAAVGSLPMAGDLLDTYARGMSGVGGDVVSLVGNTLWLSTSAVLLLLYVFPTGRILSPRWRHAVRITALGAVLSFAHDTLIHGQFRSAGDVPAFVTTITGQGNLLLLLGVAAALVNLVVRFRRAAAMERRQLRVFLAGATAMVVLMVVSALADPVGDAVFGLGLVILPASIAVAVLRYRLYDIERAIKRTVVYATVTGLLAALYAGSVLGAQAVFGPRGASDLVVAATTLVAAALFRPVTIRLQAFVDRRFNRSRYDAQLTVGAFGARLRDQVDLTALSDDLEQVVTSAVAPAHASLWLREATR